MKLEQIIEQLEKFCPPEYACDWDNVGLHVGNPKAEITKVLVCVDANEAAITKAVEEDAELIISHHPLLFHGIKQVNTSTILGRRVLTMVEQGINCYCMHTNFDACGGMSELIADGIGVMDYEVLEEVFDGKGIGIIGDLDEPCTLTELCERVKALNNLSTVCFYGGKNTILQRVAIVPGSGKDDLKLAEQKGADVMITGDITYHYGIDTVAEGMTIIDAGHYGLEQVFIDLMAEYLAKNCPDLAILMMERHNPQQYI